MWEGVTVKKGVSDGLKTTKDLHSTDLPAQHPAERAQERELGAPSRAEQPHQRQSIVNRIGGVDEGLASEGCHDKAKREESPMRGQIGRCTVPGNEKVIRDCIPL